MKSLQIQEITFLMLKELVKRNKTSYNESEFIEKLIQNEYNKIK
jgi:hypothetical protein